MMKEYDQVKLIAEKEGYSNHGVHKGMVGWICDPRNIDGTWLVSFEQYGNKPNIATIPVKETDLVMILPSGYNVKNNTKIAKLWAEHQPLPDSEN